MRLGRATWGVLILLAAPLAAAGDLFVDGVCAPDVGCVPTRVCTYDHTAGVYDGPGACQANTCDPATECHAPVRGRDDCRVNQTVDGRTCALERQGGVRVEGRGAGTPLGPVGAGDTRIDLDAAVATGYVRGRDVPHEWSSAGVAAHVVLAGVDLGRAGLAASQSRLEVADAGSDGHNFTRALAWARYDHPLGSVQTSATVLLLDASVEECRAALAFGGVPADVPPEVPRRAEPECRSLAELP